MRLAGIALVLFLSACGDAPTPMAADPASDASTDAWDLARAIEGNWVDSTHGTLAIHEQWAVHGDSIVGFGYVMRGMDTVSVENLAMVRTRTGLVYRARIATQNDGQWVSFSHQPAGNDTLVFLNPGHDFPRSIRYVLSATGELLVAVEGVEHDGQRAEHFRFRRLPVVMP